MTGKWVRGGERQPPRGGVILQVRPYELHGTPYFAVLFQLDGERDKTREARVSHEMIYANPRPRDRVLVDLVLGVVDRIQKAPPEPSL
jgi:hypothetical protein